MSNIAIKSAGAREAARHVDGRFGCQERGESVVGIGTLRTLVTSPQPYPGLYVEDLDEDEADALREMADDEMAHALADLRQNQGSPHAQMRAVAAAQTRTLVRDENIPVSESWERGGKLFLESSRQMGFARGQRTFEPMDAERRADIASECLTVAATYQGDPKVRNTYLRHAAMVLDPEDHRLVAAQLAKAYDRAHRTDSLRGAELLGVYVEAHNLT